MPIFTNVDGQWKQVPGPPTVRVGSDWVDTQAVYAHADGKWRLIWPAVEPVITVTPQTGLSAGDTATTTGKVAVPVLRATPAGLVSVAHKLTTDTSWSDTRTVNLAADGSFSVQHVVPSAGKRHWKVLYTPSNPDFFFTGEKVSDAVDVGLRTVGALTKGDLTLTSVKFSWETVPGAQQYEVHRDGELLKTVTVLNATDSELTASTKYKYKVRAIASPATGAVQGNFSTEITAEMGKPAVPRKGNESNQDVYAVRTGTFQRNGTFNQGNWLDGVTSPTVNGNLISSHPNNGNYQHYGVIQFDSAAWRAAVNKKHGEGVAANLTFSSVSLYMHRAGGGSSSAVKITLYLSNAAVGVGSNWPEGGVPPGVSNPYVVNGVAPGVSAHIGINTGFADEVLKKGTHRSLFIKSNDFDQYAVYYGIQVGAIAGSLRVSYSWNFIAEAQVDSQWV